MVKHRLDIRLVAESMLLVTACLCLLWGSVEAVQVLTDAMGNSLATSGDWSLGPAAALLVFGERGVKGATTRLIAERAGVNTLSQRLAFKAPGAFSCGLGREYDLSLLSKQ